MTYLELFRSQFDTLFQVYVQSTGSRKTVVSEIVAGYPSFYLNYVRTDFAAGKFDTILARFSAIWPESLPWPEGIKRPEPAELPEDVARLVDGLETLSDWPADKPWPADIPRPVHSSQDVGGPGA